MSRRRTSRRLDSRVTRLNVECDGDGPEKLHGKPHAVRRIARVQVSPWPDAPEGYRVQVEYVQVAQDPEDNDYMLPVRADHLTRRFVCQDCGRDRPLVDANLIRLTLTLDALGQSRVRLREIPAL